MFLILASMELMDLSYYLYLKITNHILCFFNSDLIYSDFFILFYTSSLSKLIVGPLGKTRPAYLKTDS